MMPSLPIGASCQADIVSASHPSQQQTFRYLSPSWAATLRKIQCPRPHGHPPRIPSNAIIPPSATQPHSLAKLLAVICPREHDELDARGRHSQTRLSFYFLSRLVLTWIATPSKSIRLI